MNHKYIALLCSIILLPLTMHSQVSDSKELEGASPNKRDEIEWITFEEAIEKSRQEPRPIFVDIYTSWCGWCKRMDKATFGNPEVVKYMSAHFYCIKFDAEGDQEVVFPHKTYINSGKTHDLAKELLDNRLSYPTVAFLDKSFAKLQAIPGYREAREFLMMSTFFAEEVYKYQSWEDFTKEYQNRSRSDKE